MFTGRGRLQAQDLVERSFVSNQTACQQSAPSLANSLFPNIEIMMVCLFYCLVLLVATGATIYVSRKPGMFLKTLSVAAIGVCAIVCLRYLLLLIFSAVGERLSARVFIRGLRSLQLKVPFKIIWMVGLVVSGNSYSGVVCCG